MKHTCLIHIALFVFSFFWWGHFNKGLFSTKEAPMDVWRMWRVGFCLQLIQNTLKLQKCPFIVVRRCTTKIQSFRQNVFCWFIIVFSSILTLSLVLLSMFSALAKRTFCYSCTHLTDFQTHKWILTLRWDLVALAGLQMAPLVLKVADPWRKRLKG